MNQFWKSVHSIKDCSEKVILIINKCKSGRFMYKYCCYTIIHALLMEESCLLSASFLTDSEDFPLSQTSIHCSAVTAQITPRLSESSKTCPDWSRQHLQDSSLGQDCEFETDFCFYDYHVSVRPVMFLNICIDLRIPHTTRDYSNHKSNTLLCC